MVLFVILIQSTTNIYKTCGFIGYELPSNSWKQWPRTPDAITRRSGNINIYKTCGFIGFNDYGQLKHI